MFWVFFPRTEKGQKADAMWLALLGCCCWEESGRWQEWRREQNVINQQQEHQRSKGLKAAVKITCCLTQGHNSPNRICSCSPSCSQSGRAAGCRSGLNWTVILRKTSVHASPSDTSTQPCPEAQLHTRMWSQWNGGVLPLPPVHTEVWATRLVKDTTTNSCTSPPFPDTTETPPFLLPHRQECNWSKQHMRLDKSPSLLFNSPC